MEMSGADLDRLADVRYALSAFFNPGHITALRWTGLKQLLSLKPFIKSERVWRNTRGHDRPRVGAITTVADRLP
jgi:hypothetical protein